MTPKTTLIELLERVGAQCGSAVVVSDRELRAWPRAAVAAMKAQGLITKACPATSTVCPGCEYECVMPVHVLTAKARDPAAFIVCTTRSDIHRVSVPVDRLEQWQASGESVAGLLARLLGLHRSGDSSGDATRWEVGMLKGVKHSSHLVLVADGRLTLSLAGHSIPLADVLTLAGNTFKVDRRTLNRLVDHPVAGAGDVESAGRRRERLKKRVLALKLKGVKAFLKTVAEEEGISPSRLKQLLHEDTAPAKSGRDW
jgi:hypothetical protein